MIRDDLSMNPGNQRATTVSMALATATPANPARIIEIGVNEASADGVLSPSVTASINNFVRYERHQRKEALDHAHHDTADGQTRTALPHEREGMAKRPEEGTDAIQNDVHRRQEYVMNVSSGASSSCFPDAGGQRPASQLPDPEDTKGDGETLPLLARLVKRLAIQREPRMASEI